MSQGTVGSLEIDGVTPGQRAAGATVGMVVLLLLLQAGIRNSPVITIAIIRKPNSFFRREPAELKPIPTSDTPATGSHMA